MINLIITDFAQKHL